MLPRWVVALEQQVGAIETILACLPSRTRASCPSLDMSVLKQKVETIEAIQTLTSVAVSATLAIQTSLTCVLVPRQQVETINANPACLQSLSLASCLISEEHANPGVSCVSTTSGNHRGHPNRKSCVQFQSVRISFKSTLAQRPTYGNHAHFSDWNDHLR